MVMTFSIKLVLFTIFSLCILLPVPIQVQAEIKDMYSAINKAGRQRMLSQRIVATYCQQGLGIKTRQSKDQFKDAINLYEQQLAELKKFRSYGPISKQLEKVTELWKPMRDIAAEPVMRSKAIELRKRAEEVLRASHKVVVMLQDESGSQGAQIVNIAGRQRMLSQRLSNIYMLKSWGFKSSEYTNDYSQAINEFKGALVELNASPLNDSSTINMLKQARRQFAILEESLRQKNGEFIPLMVKMSADKLLFIMNNITHAFEDLAMQT